MYFQNDNYNSNKPWIIVVCVQSSVTIETSNLAKPKKVAVIIEHDGGLCQASCILNGKLYLNLGGPTTIILSQPKTLSTCQCRDETQTQVRTSKTSGIYIR